MENLKRKTELWPDRFPSLPWSLREARGPLSTPNHPFITHVSDVRDLEQMKVTAFLQVGNKL